MSRRDLKRIIPDIKYEQWKAAINDHGQKSLGRLFLQQYELCTVLVAKALQVFFWNVDPSSEATASDSGHSTDGAEGESFSWKRRGVHVAAEDIQELNTLLDATCPLHLGFDFAHLFNHCLSGLLLDAQDRPYCILEDASSGCRTLCITARTASADA